MSSADTVPGGDPIVADLVDFLGTYYGDAIKDFALGYPEDARSFTVDWTELYQFDPDIAEDTVAHPTEFKNKLETALEEFDQPVTDLSGATVRLANLDTHSRKVDELRDDDVQKLRTISGQIAKASAVRPVVELAAWVCKRCGVATETPVSDELSPPHQCRSCERSGPFELDYQDSTVRNQQRIRIKQPPDEASNSAQIGHEIDAHIRGDLAGDISAGERADVTGVLDVLYDEDPELDFEFEAWDVESQGDSYRNIAIEEHRDAIETLTDRGEGRNPFVAVAESVAPGITGGGEMDIETPWGETYGKYWWVRLATAVASLFGSWRRENSDGTFERGSSHVLYIGDPSTGKSSIMNAIAKLAPRSAKESGKNASGPGLTAAAVKDDFGGSQWSLEAGALVKAHQGVAAIDEIDKMDKAGLSRLHSALENERLEINKAGIDATLRCETSLLAAGNPEGSRFDGYSDEAEQIDIVASLMDRFDLVYVFKDDPDEDQDSEIAESRIAQRAESGLVARGDIAPNQRSTADPEVPTERMRAWVALARQECQPVIKDESVRERLREYYVDLRQSNVDDAEGQNPVPATVRTLDGLLRLSEACARMRLSETVDPIDVEMAKAMLEVSLEDIGYDPETGRLDADFMNGRGSQSQNDRIKRIKGMVESLSGESGADRDEVLGMAESAGIDREKAAQDLEKLAEKGELYRPATGVLRPT